MKLIIILLSSVLILKAEFIAGFDEHYYALNIKEKREVFIKKINTLLDVSFKEIEKEKEFIEFFFKEAMKNNFRKLNTNAVQKLWFIKEKYRVKNLYDLHEYRVRIQVVPKSLAIAQAIIESATGASRFAKEANNLFGEWTWGEKGLVPKERSEGKTHKIRIFDTLQESVDSYLLNLNRHDAYKELRAWRWNAISQNKKLDGKEAASHLEKYSEIKSNYTKLILSIIEQHKLDELD
ncbi:glucosaminidase domain-containing protein [Campylobacter subantarcticus]|uniref:Putative FlgJ-related protein (Bax domain) n=1 Tax=Campylobacter subantarcticus LMG 24374 TaxID=1388751 RepID=A0A0A8H790_9BACT|nr:glucosaminidase domain-containing protein [Campylobacter subantarcticus]AJC89968.1 putative FlgJ-related protein (Bax domain) [Campylobacter subantarcticus LMG 24374]EAJ1260847.1 mannosyl-glycoprotein endo-beta-N-acetylglucosamidase [Campylobacter lari]